MVNPIRFGGMASGLDTESLVKQLVSAEKTRVDKFTQQKIWKQWQQTAYNETNKTMANFILDTRKNLGLTRTTSTGALISGSINTVDWVKKASSSSTAFDVTASANAPSGISTIQVVKLAKGANVDVFMTAKLDKLNEKNSLIPMFIRIIKEKSLTRFKY